MAKEVYLDASALVKRYVPETGSPAIHTLFEHLKPKLICLSLGILEIISALVRKRNAGLIPPDLYQQALLNLRSEIIDNVEVAKLSATDTLVYSAPSLIEKHSINATDAGCLALRHGPGHRSSSFRS